MRRLFVPLMLAIMIALGITVVQADNQEEANKIARELGKKYPQYNIEVAYQDGKVRLRGNIASEMERGDITRYVQQMPQVKNVAERFNIVSSLGQPLSEIDPRIVPQPNMLPAQSLPMARVINQGNVLSVAGEKVPVAEIAQTPVKETVKKPDTAPKTPFPTLPVHPLNEQQLASAPVTGKIAANKDLVVKEPVVEIVAKKETPIQKPIPQAPTQMIKVAAKPVVDPIVKADPVPVKAPMDQKPVFSLPASDPDLAPAPISNPEKMIATSPVVKSEPKVEKKMVPVEKVVSEEKPKVFKTPLLENMKTASKSEQPEKAPVVSPTLKTPVMITEVALPTMQINSKEASEIPATSFGVQEKKEPVKVAQIPLNQPIQPTRNTSSPAVEHIVNGNGTIVQPQGPISGQARPLGVVLNHGGQTVNTAPLPYAQTQYPAQQQYAVPQNHAPQQQYAAAPQNALPPQGQYQYATPQGQPIVPGQNGQPNMPNNAWPTYANYPNYSQVAYPKQYGAGSFPYMGPFYPYPQVPLGWRKVTMEWHDGYWWLDFNDGSFTGPFSPLFRQPTKYR